MPSTEIHSTISPIPCLSNNLCTCAVAIVAEVKAAASPASFAAATNQWSSLAYLQILERISVRREAPYVGDENIYQYGYGICRLEIKVCAHPNRGRFQRRKTNVARRFHCHT